MFFFLTHTQVIGLDSENVQGELQERDLVLRHIEAINAMGPHMKRAMKVFIPEVNYGMPDHLPNILVGNRDITIWKDPKSGRLGVWKQTGTDQEYQFAVSNALYHSRVRIEEDVFTCSMAASGERLTSDQATHMLQRQLGCYRYVRKEAATEFGRDRVKLSGKGGNKNDDLAMVFMMALSWGQVFLLDPRMKNTLPSLGGQYINAESTAIGLHVNNANALRAARDKLAEQAHDAKWAQRSTSRVQQRAVALDM